MTRRILETDRDDYMYISREEIEETHRVTPQPTSRFPQGALLSPHERLYSVEGLLPRYYRIDPAKGPVTTGESYFSGAFKVEEEAFRGRKRLLGFTDDYGGRALIEGTWEVLQTNLSLIKFLKWYGAVDGHPYQAPIGYSLIYNPKSHGACGAARFCFETETMNEQLQPCGKQIIVDHVKNCRLQLVQRKGENVTIALSKFPGHLSNWDRWAEDIKKLPYYFDKVHIFK